ncbi:MAG: fatty acid desaturase [Deltaproteobacteria bacterium]|nr:fatty acid desaturase [Deltaproteobacteria bacterium]
MLGLRYNADLRTLAFVAAWFALVIGMWTQGVHWAGYAVLLVLSLSMGPIAHNHVHGGTFRSSKANQLFTWIVTLSYGYPVVAWIPTHLQNHHVYGNRPGDESATWRWTHRNAPWMAFVYFPMSAWYQGRLINSYLGRLWKRHRKIAVLKTSEYVLWALWIGTALVLDWRKALLLLGAPAIVSLYSVHLFNYVQHVGCDWDSKYNQSRNFVGPIANALLFNNGFHTVHHLDGGLHWSLAPAEHAKIADLIHPELNQGNALWWLTRSYLLAFFMGEESPIEFEGRPGADARLPKAPAPRDDWSAPEFPHAA